MAEKQQQAVDEGHDADIPSRLGYVLDSKGERRLQESIASQRRLSQASKADAGNEVLDPEKQAVEDVTDDENVVFWDGDDDPDNPYNWARWRKVLNCVLVSALTFVTPLASCESTHFPRNCLRP